MNFVLYSKINKYKSTEIFPHLLVLPNPTDTGISAHSMPRAEKGQQMFPILKKTTGLCYTRSYYSMMIMLTAIKCRATCGFYVCM